VPAFEAGGEPNAEMAVGVEPANAEPQVVIIDQPVIELAQ